jgi:GNAT superfamily N-acetyltransferase
VGEATIAGAARGCEAIAWSGPHLATRCLSAAELRDEYLPLRYDVLHSELQWTVGAVRSPSDLCDVHDRASVAYGVFDGDARLIGASRLILSADEHELPSLRLLVALGRRVQLPEPAAEISRVMVHRDYRRLGLFRVLLLSGLLLAEGTAVRTLVLTERDDARSARVMTSCGFTRFADGFSFVDQVIAPSEPAATYVLDVRGSLGAESRQALAAHREVLLQAAEGLVAAAGANRAAASGRR